MTEHNSEEEPEETFHLDPEEVQEVVMWAIHTATTITLMQHHPGHDNDREGIERLQGYIEAIDMVYNDLPDCIVEVSHSVAQDIVNDAEANEAIVDEFVEELKDL